jgi:hypothetical protein
LSNAVEFEKKWEQIRRLDKETFVLMSFSQSHFCSQAEESKRNGVSFLKLERIDNFN